MVDGYRGGADQGRAGGSAVVGSGGSSDGSADDTDTDSGTDDSDSADSTGSSSTSDETRDRRRSRRVGGGGSSSDDSRPTDRDTDNDSGSGTGRVDDGRVDSDPATGGGSDDSSSGSDDSESVTVPEDAAGDDETQDRRQSERTGGNDTVTVPDDAAGDDESRDRQESERTRPTPEEDDPPTNDDILEDQRQSRRVGGSGDPTDDQPVGGDFEDDQSASERAGGSGDPSAEPESRTADSAEGSMAGGTATPAGGEDSPFVEDQAAAQFNEETVSDVDPSDVMVLNDGTVTLTPQARRTERRARTPQNTGGTPFSREQQIQATRERLAAEVSEETGQDYSAEDVEVTTTEDGRVEFSVNRRESFDLDYSAGLGGDEDEVENTIDDLASGYSSTARDVGTRLFAADDPTGNSAGAMVLRAAGRDELASDYDQGVRNLGAGLVSGGAAIGNVPGILGAGLEANEVVASGARKTASGSGTEFTSEAYDRATALGEAAVESARENKARTGGAAFGSLVASAGAISAASRVSSRAGAATRYAIQPGEELAGSAGFRATRAVANERTAQRAFPNREPLIFSEEAAIRGGRAAADATRRAGSSTASRVAREATALRFRAEEALRSDAPSRGTSDNLVSRASQRAQQEAVSARFRAAEASSRARDRASDVSERIGERASSARERASEFRSDDRAQAQVPRSRSEGRNQQTTEIDGEAADQAFGGGSGVEPPRSRLREETTRPGIDRERARRPELETETDSGLERSRGRRLESNIEAETGSPISRLREAQRTSVDSRAETLGGRTDLETRIGSEGLGRTRGRTDTRLGSELRSGNELSSELSTEIGTESRSDLRTETETRSQLRTELELETRSESRIESEGFDLRGTRGGDGGGFGGGDPFGRVVERDLINPLTGE